MIALSMIVSPKEKAEDLKRCLDTVKGKVDKIFIVITGKPSKKLKEVAEKYAVVEYKTFNYTVPSKMVKFIKKMNLEPLSNPGDKLFEFDKARNYSMEMVPKEYEWMIWLDTDDILRGDLRQVVERAEANNADSVFLNYLYEVEIVNGKIKNVLIEHMRERLIKNTGIYKWVAPIHETLIEQKPTRKIEDKTVDVVHLSDRKRRETAIQRNLKNLEYSIYKTKGEDPRPLYYLAKAYFDMWLTTQDKKYLGFARGLIEKYLHGDHKSGWAEERSQAWEYLVEIYRTMGDFKNAIKCGHNALIEDERFPSIYVNMALSYVSKGEWNRAIHWVKLAGKLPQPASTLITTPRDLMARSMEVIYHASLNLSKLEEAGKAAENLVGIYPDRPEMKARLDLVNSLKEQSEITKTVVTLARYLENKGEPFKLKPLMMAVPDTIKDNPFMSDLMNKVNPPRKHGEKEVSIYCGPGFTTWSPNNLENKGESFVGGSEEAVMYLAQSLKKQGWKVTVYADPGPDEGDFDGVTYLPYFKFNKNDKFNILVAWRRPDFVDWSCEAKKTYIWAHDIQNQLDYTQERLEKITKIIVLSPWHRTNLPDIPDDKILISSNGLKI